MVSYEGKIVLSRLKLLKMLVFFFKFAIEVCLPLQPEMMVGRILQNFTNVSVYFSFYCCSSTYVKGGLSEKLKENI